MKKLIIRFKSTLNTKKKTAETKVPTVFLVGAGGLGYASLRLSLLRKQDDLYVRLALPLASRSTWTNGSNPPLKQKKKTAETKVPTVFLVKD